MLTTEFSSCHVRTCLLAVNISEQHTLLSAHEVALSHNRKTISAADILSALEIVQLDQKNKALEAELKST